MTYQDYEPVHNWDGDGTSLQMRPDRVWPGPSGSQPQGQMIPIEGLLVWAFMIEQAEHDYPSAASGAPNGYAGISRCGAHHVLVNHLLGTIIPSSAGITGSIVSPYAVEVRDTVLSHNAWLAANHGRRGDRPEIERRARLGMVPREDKQGQLLRDGHGALVPSERVMRYSSRARYRFSLIDWDVSPSWVASLAEDYDRWLSQLRMVRAELGGAGAQVGPWVLDAREPPPLPVELATADSRLTWTKRFDMLPPA